MLEKVILTHEVTGLGSPGEIVEVRPGYARNYLVPQGLAVGWTRGGQKQVDQIRAARTARELATIEEAKDLKDRLEANPVRVAVKAGREGRLFGSVKPADIATAIAEAGIGSVDKRKIELGAAIKAVGEHEATLRLREDLVATISLRVVAAK